MFCEFANRSQVVNMKSRGKNFKPHSRKNDKSKHRKKFSLHANKRKREDFKKEVEITKKPKLEENHNLNHSSESEGEDSMKVLRDALKTTHDSVISAEEDSEDGSEISEEVGEVENDHLSDEQSEDNNEVIDDVEDDEAGSGTEDIEHSEPLDDSKNPFSKRISYELSSSLLNSVQSNPMVTETSTENWPILGKILIKIPKCEDSEAKQEFSIDNQKAFAPKGEVPQRIALVSDLTPEKLFIKPQISGNLRKANSGVLDDELKKNCKVPFNDLQAELFSVINNYQDLFYPHRSFDNAEQIRFVYCLHAANHILKTRTKVLHHNARLASKDDVPEEFRDQGLVRPKILIIVPFRDSAYKIVNMISNIFFEEDKGNVINKNRFIEDYTGHEIAMPKKNPKPEDYEQIFTGNSSDDFKIGITVTKKSLKLYADFYSSDIIIASPLGLRLTIGAEGEAERDFDFLASIELLIFDQMEIFLMQNFFHVLQILDHMHVQPKDSHGTDFSRVRHWSLNGWSKYYRQTLMFASMIIPEANSILMKYCFNYAGTVNVVNPIENGSIKQVVVQLPHVYQRFSASTLADAVDARFDYFINKILPEHRDPLMKQTLVYIPSYYDFVKIRNYFKREDISFVQICEYSKASKIARARDMFFHGDAHFLLYTERYHFFNRIRLKGIRHLIFYQPPTFPHFYSELCNFMMECNMNKKIGSLLNMSVSVIYSKFDGHQLASIVGSKRAATLLKSGVHIHTILTKS